MVFAHPEEDKNVAVKNLKQISMMFCYKLLFIAYTNTDSIKFS